MKVDIPDAYLNAVEVARKRLSDYYSTDIKLESVLVFALSSLDAATICYRFRQISENRPATEEPDGTFDEDKPLFENVKAS